jgi:hypothetical protein
MLLGIKPEREEALTPAEAFKQHQTPTPAEVYARLQDGSGTAIVYPPSAPAAAVPAGEIHVGAAA